LNITFIDVQQTSHTVDPLFISLKIYGRTHVVEDWRARCVYIVDSEVYKHLKEVLEDAEQE
jgi:hypothetical protein